MALDPKALNMTDAEFSQRYPVIWDFLDTTIRPDVDGYNLLEMLDRVLRRAHPDRAKRLVAEFESLSRDHTISPEDLETIFNIELESPYKIIQRANARDVIYSLAEYLRYLLDTVRVGRQE
jgi:hypothetical protein